MMGDKETLEAIVKHTLKNHFHNVNLVKKELLNKENSCQNYSRNDRSLMRVDLFTV